MTDYKSLVDFKLFMVQDTKSVEEILTSYVNKNPPNLVVVGSTNKEGISKWVLGSVSDYCLHNCHCPVSLVHNNVDI
ncbi:hypothetical protein CLU79DRAFT_773559 [Phycomyces nitens]|nr:hypothetical protein CLU79DRAFT_773559 [Phycomyces nitens]